MVKDEILVQFKSASRDKSMGVMIAQSLGGTLKRSFCRGKYAVISLRKGNWPPEAARYVMKNPVIEAASPVYRRTISATFPDDPAFTSYLWALNNTGQTIIFDTGPAIGRSDADVDAPEAWDLATGSQSIIVAVIDTGISLTHPDLIPNLWINTDEVPGDNKDNDSNGYKDDVNGYNFYANTPSPMDDHGHGSFCSGIIGARGNNNLGISGLNWQVSIMGLKCFSSSGSASDPDIVEAIEYAADNGARIINASWTGYQYSPIIENAIHYAADKGVLFVNAAGNDGNNLFEHPNHPSISALPNLLSVGSSNFLDAWSSFSNFDDTLVDLIAPGEKVYSTTISSYGFGSGTSFSTPYAAGAAALLLSTNPALTPAQLRFALIAGFESRPSLDRRSMGNGRMSAYEILSNRASDSTPPGTINDLFIAVMSTNGFELRFTAPGDDGDSGMARIYDVRVSTSPLDNENFPFAERVRHMPKPAVSGTLQRFFISGRKPATTYYMRMLVYDDAGNPSGLSNQVAATTSDRSVIFSDDMEQDESKWTPIGGFARTTEDSHSGLYSWTESPGEDYTKGQLASLTSIPIDLSGVSDPWISFHHEYIFEDVTATFYDGGELQVSINGLNYKTIAFYYDFSHPWRRENISLADYAGESSVQIRFNFHADNVSLQYDGWHIDDVEIYEPFSMVPEPADFVVESRYPFGVTFNPEYTETTSGGGWLDSSSKGIDAHMRALKSRYNLIDDGLGSTARFTPIFSVDGRYEVFALWGISANANHVWYRISHAKGSDDIYLNQNGNTNANQWISLGTYSFSRGRSINHGSVLVDESSVTGKPLASSEGRIYSDAIRFVFISPPLPTGWQMY